MDDVKEGILQENFELLQLEDQLTKSRNSNKVAVMCMVFHQLSLLDQTRTRVAWELTSESLHESFINFHCLIKREQELHESNGKREFTWEFHQPSLLDQTRTRVAWELASESLHESFINFHCLIKREQELHESNGKREFTWEFHQPSLLDQTRTRVAWELTSESLHESFINFHCLIKREQELHESNGKREFTWEFHQPSLLDQTRTRVAWELTSESLHESFINFHCLIKREQELHESNGKREFTWEFHQLSLLDQTRTRVAWELTSESLHESFINFHCLIKREQELHESNGKREFTWEFYQLFFSVSAVSPKASWRSRQRTNLMHFLTTTTQAKKCVSLPGLTASCGDDGGLDPSLLLAQWIMRSMEVNMGAWWISRVNRRRRRGRSRRLGSSQVEEVKISFITELYCMYITGMTCKLSTF